MNPLFLPSLSNSLLREGIVTRKKNRNIVVNRCIKNFKFVIFLRSDCYNFIIGYIHIYIYFFYSKRTTLDFLFQRFLLQNFFVETSREREKEREVEGERNNNWKQLLTVTPFFFIFALSNLIPDSCYPILILVHRSNRGYRSTQLFGSSEATVFCLPSNTPTAFHRNILIAMNNCRRDKTIPFLFTPPSPLQSKNFRINYRGIIIQVWNFGIGSNKWRQEFDIFGITH